MCNCVEGLSEVKFEQYDLFARALTLVYVLICPSKAILYSPPLNEAVLVLVDDLKNDFLQPISQDFRDDF